MRKQRNIFQCNLPREYKVIKDFLQERGFNISALFRKFMRDLYEQEMKKAS